MLRAFHIYMRNVSFWICTFTNASKQKKILCFATEDFGYQ